MSVQHVMKCRKCRSENIVVNIEIVGVEQFEQVKGIFSEENSVGLIYTDSLTPTGKQTANCLECGCSWRLRIPLEKRANYAEETPGWTKP